MMKNKLLYDYCIDKRLILLLGVKESEIVEWCDWHIRFRFKRNGKDFLIQVDMNDKKSSLSISLKQVLSNLLTDLSVIVVTDVVDESGFEKFRNLMEIYFKPVVEVSANE